MGKNTPFQLCYLALLMFNVIKQQGGLELLEKYYSMTMTQLFEDKEWQQDTAWSFLQAFEYLMDGVEKSEDEIF
jgi:hypothetical protein